MLREIHLSKNTYCVFADPADHQYDIIINSVKDVTDAIELHSAILSQLPAAKQAKIDRIKRDSGVELSADSIDPSELVFRVMTWNHIPLAPPKPAKTVKASKAKKLVEELDQDVVEDEIESDPIVAGLLDPTHVRVNFPPFQHFRIDARNTNLDETVANWMYPVQCVGKSHWKGSLTEGEFSKTHGQMTENLALMFIKLCERYATRSNWRYYTYNDEMRGAALVQLSQIGLQFDESKSNNPFSYFTASLNNSFLRILNIEKRNQAIRDDILEMNGLTPSFSRQAQWLNKE